MDFEDAGKVEVTEGDIDVDVDIDDDGGFAYTSEKGNKAYYKCSCGELFADKDAQKEITLAEVEIEAKGHEYETEYTKDAKYHWKKCKNCDAVTEKQEHTSSGAATEENAEQSQDGESL